MNKTNGSDRSLILNDCEEDDCCGNEKDAVNPFKYLYREKRVIYFSNPIASPASDMLTLQLMELDDRDHTEQIKVMFDSGGGSLSDGLKLYDKIQEIEAPIHIHCYGIAASMAAVLLSSGAPGHRYISPSARTMLHLPKNVFRAEQGLDPKDMEIAKRQLELNYERIIDILAYHTGQNRKKIKKDIDRDFWMSAQETVEYGLADHVIEHEKGIYSQKSVITSAIRKPAKKLTGLVVKAKDIGTGIVGVFRDALKR